MAFGTNCRSAPVPFIFLRHYCTQMRGDLFCFLDAAEFFSDDNRARPFKSSLGSGNGTLNPADGTRLSAGLASSDYPCYLAEWLCEP